MAIVLVIMVHAAIEPHPIIQETDFSKLLVSLTANTYNSLARPSVPLFVMLSGALLLQPSRVEPIRVFLRKRLVRLGLPFVFWGTAYFAWRYFVNHEALSVSSVFQGILTGPYYHFWFLYMLFGLYLITPVLRVITVHSERKIIRYFLLLWFFGTGIVPLLVLVSGLAFELKLFAVTGWIGYFLLGYYLLSTRFRSSTLVISFLTGVLWTVFGTYVANWFVGGTTGLFFLDYLSISVILASSSLYALLLKSSPGILENRLSRASWIIKSIGQNTLPIYLFHIMILESLQKGYFGFQISLSTMNPVFEIPFVTIVTLFLSLGGILLLKKVPVVKRLIG